MSAGSLKVKIFDAKGTNVVPVAKSTATVGSNSHCDVVLEHESIQGEHVRAWLDGGRIWIQDLGTTGGTFLNGIRLPPLKPMLVRDLDVLKLGDCPATLGLEANLVRAPIVKPHVPAEEHTLTDIKPAPAKDSELEKRRDELAKVSRELAELKLQLQMGRLDKNSTEELRKQINSLREELRVLGEQRERMSDSLKKLDDDKHKKISATEAEIVEMKMRAERDIKDMRDSHGRKLGHWKVDAVAELSKQVHLLTLQKQKSWNTRPLSQDMIFELESDMNQMIRRVLLDEESHPPAVPEHTHTEITNPDVRRAVLAEKAARTASTSTSTSTRTKKTSAMKRPSLRVTPNWSRIGLGLIGVAIVGVIIWVARPYVRRSSVRGMASQQSVAPQAGPARYQPKQNKFFKKTYTENILYTERYAEAELNSDFRQRWMAEFTRAARAEMKLDDRTISTIAGKEHQLLQDLQRLRDSLQAGRAEQGIAQMRARESVFQQELLSLLKTPQLVEKYQRLKRGFFTKNQAYLVKQTR